MGVGQLGSQDGGATKNGNSSQTHLAVDQAKKTAYDEVSNTLQLFNVIMVHCIAGAH